MHSFLSPLPPYLHSIHHHIYKNTFDSTTVVPSNHSIFTGILRNSPESSCYILIISENMFVKMEGAVTNETDLNLKATELRLGLPGTDETEKEAVSGVRSNKRASPETSDECEPKGSSHGDREPAPVAKAQVVGWPPIRSYRKNSFQPKKDEAEGSGMFVKVSMDGAPYLRKIDLKVYKGYPDLLQALQNMFKFTIGEYSEREGYKGSEYVPTYEDKDGDWMLVGDVPWDMFMSSCKKLRIMKGSEARGLGCGV